MCEGQVQKLFTIEMLVISPSTLHQSAPGTTKMACSHLSHHLALKQGSPPDSPKAASDKDSSALQGGAMQWLDSFTAMAPTAGQQENVGRGLRLLVKH